MELDKLYYSRKEAAKILGVNISTIQRYIKNGQLPAKKVGKLWRIPKEALEYKPPTSTQE